MTIKKSKISLEEIAKAMDQAFLKVYVDAVKNGDTLVISESGKIKHIKPAEEDEYNPFKNGHWEKVMGE